MFKSVIGLLLVVAFCTAEAPTRLRSNGRRTNIRFLARQQQAPLAPAPTGYSAAGVTPEIPFNLPSSTVKPDVTYLPPDNTYGPPSTPPPQRKPDATYGPPAPHNTYGPPPDNSYLPPEDSITERVAVDENQDEVEVEVKAEAEGEEQQPTAPQPEIQDQPKEQADEPADEEEEEILVTVADDGTVIAVSNSFDAQGVQSETQAANAQQPARLVYQRFPQNRRGAPADVPVPARLIKMRRMVPAKLRQPQRIQQQQPQPQGFSFLSQYTAW